MTDNCQPSDYLNRFADSFDSTLSDAQRSEASAEAKEMKASFTPLQLSIVTQSIKNNGVYYDSSDGEICTAYRNSALIARELESATPPKAKAPGM